MILIVDMNWKKDSLGYYEFVLPIARIVVRVDRFITKHFLEVCSKDLNLCDKIILSGTTLKDNTTLNQLEKFNWLKKIEKPVLGICAGMETIGLIYGARLQECVEIGMTNISTTKENPLFKSDFAAYSLHSICVEESEEFESLARSPQCIQAIKQKNKDIYGVLFHPEVRNPEIITNFIQG